MRRGGWRWEFKDTCSLLGLGNFDDQTVQGVRGTHAMSANFSLLFLPTMQTSACGHPGEGDAGVRRSTAARARSTLEIGEKISRSGRAGSLAAAHRHAEKKPKCRQILRRPTVAYRPCRRPTIVKLRAA